MRLALSSYAYNWAVGIPDYPPERLMTVFDLLDKAVQHGVHVVQVVDNIPFEQIPREEQDRFVHYADQRGVEIELGMRGIQGNHLAVQAARQRQHAEPFKEHVIRSGIEGTIDQATDKLGMRRSRYRGMTKTNLHHGLTAAAINLKRAMD